RRDTACHRPALAGALSRTSPTRTRLVGLGRSPASDLQVLRTTTAPHRCGWRQTRSGAMAPVRLPSVTGESEWLEGSAGGGGLRVGGGGGGGGRGGGGGGGGRGGGEGGGWGWGGGGAGAGGGAAGGGAGGRLGAAGSVRTRGAV